MWVCMMYIQGQHMYNKFIIYLASYVQADVVYHYWYDSIMLPGRLEAVWDATYLFMYLFMFTLINPAEYTDMACRTPTEHIAGVCSNETNHDPVYHP